MTAEYPGSPTTLLGMHTAVNNKKISITAAIDDVVTTIPTSDTSDIPSKGYLTFTDGSEEVIYYGGKTLNSLTSVIRGADDTNNVIHADASEIEMRWNADFHNRQSEEIKAISDDNRSSFISDLDDGVTPATTAASLKIRLDHIATQLKLLSGKVDWKTAPLTTLEAEGADTDNIETVDLDESATPATTASSIKDRLDQIANRLIAITGKADWKTSPADTQENLDSRVTTNATNIGTNVTDIGDNATDIGTNATAITDIENELAAIQADLDDAVAPVAGAADLNVRLNHIATQLKLITGEADWKTAPATDLASIAAIAGEKANLIINGGPNIWQRGTNFVDPSGLKTADRWEWSQIGIATFTVSQEASVIERDNYSMKCVFSHGGGATRLRVGQFPEDSLYVSGDTYTMRARVKSNAAGFRLFVVSAAGSLGATTAHTGDDTWQTLTLTMTPTTGLSVWMGWDSGITNGTAPPTSGTVYIQSVNLVNGSSAFEFVAEDPAIDLQRCKRHFQKIGKDTAVQQIATLHVTTTTQAEGGVHLPATMASTPTITVYNQASFKLTSATGSAINCTTILVGSPHLTGCYINPQVASGLVAGNATLFSTINTSAVIYFEA